MNASDIFTQARKLAFVDSSQFPDAQMVVWLNFLYQELCGDIKKCNENYFYVRWYIDTVAYQNTYTFTLPTSSVISVQKILQMTVKYLADSYPAWTTWTSYLKWDKVVNTATWKSYVANQDNTAWATFAGDAAKRVQIFEWYTEAREVNFWAGDVDRYNAETMNAFIDRYGRMTDINNPVYLLHSTSNQMQVSIYPYVESAIVQGIKYDGIATIIDLWATATEAEILIERNYHKVLVLWLLPYIYQARWMYNENIMATNNFMEAKRKMLSEITDRVFSATEVWNPNLVWFE